MNLKSYSEADIKSAFKEVFNKPVDIKHLEHMLSYRFLGELEQITDEKNINRKELAKMLGVSASYITQLYRGSKIVNMEFLAKVEQAFDFRFDIRAVAKEVLEINESPDRRWSERQMNYVIQRMPATQTRVWIAKNIKQRDRSKEKNSAPNRAKTAAA
ncbi:MAG TPA: helix-turn-helix transcriptional regulator [Flavipsychrobacter sp.]|nr:helix-turn-helix transcriptional regulator [Flavipsychrobacter sp.]